MTVWTTFCIIASVVAVRYRSRLTNTVSILPYFVVGTNTVLNTTIHIITNVAILTYTFVVS